MMSLTLNVGLLFVWFILILLVSRSVELQVSCMLSVVCGVVCMLHVVCCVCCCMWVVLHVVCCCMYAPCCVLCVWCKYLAGC